MVVVGVDEPEQLRTGLVEIHIRPERAAARLPGAAEHRAELAGRRGPGVVGPAPVVCGLRRDLLGGIGREPERVVVGVVVDVGVRAEQPRRVRYPPGRQRPRALNAADRGAGIVVEHVRRRLAHQVDPVEGLAAARVHDGVVEAQVAAAHLHAPGEPVPEHRQVGALAVAETGQALAAGRRAGRAGHHRDARCAPGGEQRVERGQARLDRRHGGVGLGALADVDQATVGIDVRAQARAEDRDAAMELLPLEMYEAARGAIGAGQAQPVDVALVEPEARRAVAHVVERDGRRRALAGRGQEAARALAERFGGRTGRARSRRPCQKRGQRGEDQTSAHGSIQRICNAAAQRSIVDEWPWAAVRAACALRFRVLGAVTVPPGYWAGDVARERRGLSSDVGSISCWRRARGAHLRGRRR